MKIIGRTEDGGRIVEISTEELIALAGAAKTLVHICSSMIPVAPGEQPLEGRERNGVSPACNAMRSIAGRVCGSNGFSDRSVGKEITGRTARRSVPTKETSNRHKTCEICGKGFLDKSRSNNRRICENTACKKEWKHRANVAYRKNQVGKPAKEIACLTPAANPAKGRLCLWCKKPLPADANSNMKTHKGECKTMFCREYARNHYFIKHGRKSPPRESILNVGPATDPSNPALTDAERKAATTFKEKRLALIKAAVEKHQYDNAD
jgi:hypothetical protein